MGSDGGSSGSEAGGPSLRPPRSGGHPRKGPGQVWAGQGPQAQAPSPRPPAPAGGAAGGPRVRARGEVAVDGPTVRGGVGRPGWHSSGAAALPPRDPEDREGRVSGRRRGGGLRAWGGALGQAWAAGEPAAGPSRVCWGRLSGEREGQCRLRRRSLGEVKVAAARRGGRRRRPRRTPPRGCHEQRVAACGVTGPPSVAGLGRGCPLPAFTAMRGSS